LVGIILLGALVVVLCGALALDRTLRPSVGIEPVPGSGAEADPIMRQVETPAMTAAAAASPTQSPQAAAASGGPQTPERAVEQAYLRYWDVYAAALLELDDSRLSEVASADELRRIQDEITRYRRAGYAVRVRVTHNYVVVDVTADEARVADEMVDRSFRVDPVTKNPPQGPDVGTTVRDLFVLQRIDGVWKVTKSVRESG
jgi:hypothetical protein